MKSREDKISTAKRLSGKELLDAYNDHIKDFNPFDDYFYESFQIIKEEILYRLDNGKRKVDAQHIIDLIEEMSHAVPGDEDLELEHLYKGGIGSGITVSGWYAYRYSEKRRSAVPLFDSIEKCLIVTDEDLVRNKIDMDVDVLMGIGVSVYVGESNRYYKD